MYGLHGLDMEMLAVYPIGITYAGLWAARKVLEHRLREAGIEGVLE